MSAIVQAILSARAEMAPLVADEKASISGQRGSYSFRYVSLSGLIDTVSPPLAKHGIVLSQDVFSDFNGQNKVCVVTKLIHASDTIYSGELWLDTDGTPTDMAKKVTSARRIQLMSLLGLAAVDEDVPDQRPMPQRQPSPPPQRQPILPDKPIGPTWEAQANLRKAVEYGNKQPPTGDLLILMERAKQTDNNSVPMPVTPAEGKSTSMFAYLCSLIESATERGAAGLVLSYLLGRVISESTPPSIELKFLIDELREGRHKDTLAVALARAGGKT